MVSGDESESDFFQLKKTDKGETEVKMRDERTRRRKGRFGGSTPSKYGILRLMEMIRVKESQRENRERERGIIRQSGGK